MQFLELLKLCDLDLDLDWVEVILVHTHTAHTKLYRNPKKNCGRTYRWMDTPELQSISSLPGGDLKIKLTEFSNF